MTSSLNLHHFSQYPCSCQQSHLLHHCNIIYYLKLYCFVTLPRASITTGSTFFNFNFNLPISLFKVLVFLHFSSTTLSRWTLISHRTVTSSFSTTTSGTCSYHFSVCSSPFFLQRSQWTFFTTLSCHLFYSFYTTFNIFYI